MNIIVSAFISNGNTHRSIETYIEYGKKLINIPINKIIFIEKKIYDEYLLNPAFITDEILLNTTFIFINREDMYLYEYYDQITNFNPITTNSEKDTIDYMFIQCYKTEFMKKAIEYKSTKSEFIDYQFIWLDFGIYHIINNDDLFIQIINVLESNNIYNCIRIAGGYYIESDIYRQVCWFFLGGIFGGSANKLLEFADLMKKKCIDTIQNKKTITWEVNLWYLIYLENPDLFSRYIANHDKNMIIDYVREL